MIGVLMLMLLLLAQVYTDHLDTKLQESGERCDYMWLVFRLVWLHVWV